MSSALPYATGAKFRGAHLRAAAVPGIAAAVLVAGYLGGLLQLDAAGWREFAYSVLVAAALLTPLGQYFQRKSDRDVVEAIDAERAGRLTQAQLEAGFRAASVLPRTDSKWTFANWGVAAVVAPVWMALRLPGLDEFSMGVIAVGSLVGGFATSPFLYLQTKSLTAPLCDHWGARIEPQRRAELVAPLSLRVKIALPFLAVAVATVVFLGLLGWVMAGRPVEAQDARVKQAFLRYAAEQLAQGASPADLEQRGREFSVLERLVVLQPGADAARASGLGPAELAAIAASGESQGDGTGLDSPHSFAWRRASAGGPVLVAYTDTAVFHRALSGSLAIVVVVLLGVLAVACVVALLLAREIRGAVDHLSEHASRIASGDLRPARVVESDDELGGLLRTFSEMAASLRETVSGVDGAASRVEAASTELVTIGHRVAQVTADQVRGIDQASTAMASMNARVSRVTGAWESLSGEVEEVTSSVLELGAAGEELNQTAGALHTQVEQVSSSIEQMIASVGQVAGSADTLGEAVTETSSSMSEMTRSMQSVEGHAGETARLSSRVVALADSGRDKVQETIRGMDEIRAATEAAERIIESLAGRMQEIGAIVNVIDDVADETNLLALNAAIIAAQSGEQGRAFSVVADEIKDLADRVLASTKEIGGLIATVQAESASAASAVARGSESVQSGVELSAQAGLALEEITGAARDSGARTEEIVGAVREQARAAGHVERLMERVSLRVNEIRAASREQAHGNEVVLRGSGVMREVAQQTTRTTEEQARGVLRIRDSMESVRGAVEQIQDVLREQTEACRQAVSQLEDVSSRTRANDEASVALRASAQALVQQAEALREGMRRFRIS